MAKSLSLRNIRKQPTIELPAYIMLTPGNEVLVDSYVPVLNISPETAQLLLANNPENRKINEERVSRYSKEMETGKWQYNGESIKICEDGSLLDSQHRLEAISRTGLTQKMVVVRDLPRSVFTTIDIGKTRNLVDLLYINGYMYTDKVAGAARLIGMFSRNQEITRTQIKTRTSLSIEELFNLVKSRPTLQDDTVNAMKSYATLISLAGSPNSVALYHLFKEKDKTLATEYFDKLNSGHMLDKNSVIYQCRELLLAHRRDSATGRYTNSSYILYLMVKTWNSMRNGTYDTRLVKDDSLPIPVIQ